ncbi:serine/threonine-protein kinase [Pseudarthrobacter sulfonivorans]|uniref:serine/threonine-protein kinase n=1 Tax=Pseudarthrobacter sulfonivorans TaxID=121292 RepID=UPI0021071340|nr:serine/threonine-protein kinase [Pseudarthrobacter sulfonivorans]
MPGDVLVGGRFRLREQLGRGSMAGVFRAVDLTGGRDVAVKIAADDSPKYRGRIANEAAILAGLDHPSVVTFFAEGTMAGQGELSGRPYIVEELALGPSLAEVGRGPRRSPAEVAAWAGGLFDGLSHLHERGVVHRDIKPANLMLSGLRRSRVRIVDFGIAAAAGAPPEPGMSSGTVHYMSPEQASGGSAQPCWDVYALGLVLLELLTGTRAYTGTAVESLVARTLRSPLVPAALGPGWVALLRAVTAMDSAARPSAAEAAVMARRLAVGPQPVRLLHRR